jgi:tight adherence protein B
MMLLPYLYLVFLKNRRTNKFLSQLHEALDLIARALKAGHSFNSAMQLAAEEFEDPLGTEFQETIDEINFGVSMADALKTLSARLDCSEIKYFVVAVIIQRETGGNLAELVESLADLLRKRFKFQGRIKVLSAEGRMSAMILILLPFLIAGFLQFTNPTFLVPLFTETIGQFMLGGAGIMMLIGILVMKKMVKIEV